MCIVAQSESGHGGRFEPCEECKRLQAEVEKHKSRREHFEDLLNGSIEHENEWTQRAISVEAENAALRQERGLIVEKADALAEAVEHASDLREVADFLRKRIEESRQSVEKPWRMQFDEFTAAVKEMANRRIAFDELYECTEYTSLIDMIEDAAKAYQEVRHAG